MDSRLAFVVLIVGICLGYLISLGQVSELQSTVASLEAEISASAEYDVHVLNDREYYHSVKNDIASSNNTIMVAMYSMKYDPDDSFDWANDLIHELGNAKTRGVNVTVVIENRTYFGYMNENLEAYIYLIANDVAVQLDNDDDTDHMKLIIIDDSIVYVGSHNWSESALYHNHETSVRIVSEEIAMIFKTYFETEIMS